MAAMSFIKEAWLRQRIADIKRSLRLRPDFKGLKPTERQALIIENLDTYLTNPPGLQETQKA
jgi:hypothetical protein